MRIGSIIVITGLFYPGILYSEPVPVSPQDSTLKKDTLVRLLPDSFTKPALTGYASQTKAGITGSVSFCDPSDLTIIPAENITPQLQGRLSGVTVTGNGQPGTISKVRIRGFSSFQNNDPLYIIDGVPTQDVSFLNPNDIESLCVLKDAGAATIYGSRASNGVIVIKTKSGGKGIKVNYSMYAGIQSPGSGTKGAVLNTQEYADLQWLVYENDQTYETHPIYGSSQNPEPTIPSWAADTDWYNEITQPAGMMNHDLSFSGGTDKSKFYAGFRYFSQDGIVIHTNSKRYNARFNSEFTFLKDHLRVGENITLSYHNGLTVPNLSEGSPIQIGPYRSQSIIPVVISEPISGMYHDFLPGEWGGTGMAPRLGPTPNPVATLTRDKDDSFWDSGLTGSAYIDLMIFPGLNFRSTFGGTLRSGYGVDYTYYPYESANAPYNTSTPNLMESSFHSGDWVWTNLITFERSMGKHKILALAGYEASEYGTGRDLYARKFDYYSDDPDFRTLTTGAEMQDMGSDFFTPVRNLSLFLKTDYIFNEKYLAGITFRRDGCSNFGEDHRYATFASVSAGWRISSEAFFKGITFINDLKIRGSYGTTGNQFAIFPTSAGLLFKGNIAYSFYDINGTGNSAVTGYYTSQYANPDIRGETGDILNFGLESLMWNNRLGITVDWYKKKSDNLLYKFDSNWIIPATIGETDHYYVNSGSMENSGVDIEITFTEKWKNFGISSAFIFTTYKNEITGVAGSIDYFNSGESFIGPFSRNMAGDPISSFYGFQVLGLFKNSGEVGDAPVQDGAEPGFMRFANLNTETDDYSDYQRIDQKDRTIIGNPNPKYTFGFDLGLTFKNLSFSAFLYGSHGNDIFNYNRWWTDFWSSFQGQKSNDLLYNSWTERNLSAKVPKASNNSNFSSNQQVCSYYIENGSYLRLKSLRVGYTFPAKVLGKTGISSMTLYLQGINLFTIAGYSGLDPEIEGMDTCFGVDSGNYPHAKQILFGLSLCL